MRKLCFMALGLLAVVGVAGWHPRGNPRAIRRRLGAAPAPSTAAVAPNPLDTLDWLVGDWVDASGGLTAESSCHFTKNKAFLIRSFRIVTRRTCGCRACR